VKAADFLLVSQSIIASIKAATVAIGLLERGTVIPYSINGTGFIYDTKGYVMTAAHVAQDCVEQARSLRAQKPDKDIQPAVFRLFGRGLDAAIVEKFSAFDLDTPNQPSTNPKDLDIACG